MAEQAVTHEQQRPSIKRPRRKPGENRAHLLLAGIREFGLRGYHGTSTASIARGAGVPQPHVYSSFRTKQELYLACLERVSELIAADHQVSGFPRVQNEHSLEPDEIARFLLQTTVALGERTSVEPRLRESLAKIHAHMGDELFYETLQRAAESFFTLRTTAR